MKKSLLAIVVAGALMPLAFAAQTPAGQTDTSKPAKTAKTKKHHSKKAAKTPAATPQK